MPRFVAPRRSSAPPVPAEAPRNIARDLQRLAKIEAEVKKMDEERAERLALISAGFVKAGLITKTEADAIGPEAAVKLGELRRNSRPVPELTFRQAQRAAAGEGKDIATFLLEKYQGVK